LCRFYANTIPFYKSDLHIWGYWYPQQTLEPIPQGLCTYKRKWTINSSGRLLWSIRIVGLHFCSHLLCMVNLRPTFWAALVESQYLTVQKKAEACILTGLLTAWCLPPWHAPDPCGELRGFQGPVLAFAKDIIQGLVLNMAGSPGESTDPPGCLQPSQIHVNWRLLRVWTLSENQRWAKISTEMLSEMP
jgi:hypothetical protein